MFMMLDGLYYCCSSLCNVSLTPLTSSENQTRPVPKVGESRIDMRNCLPYYTAGFD